MLVLSTGFTQTVKKKREMSAKLFAEGLTLSEASLQHAKSGKVRYIVMKNDKGAYTILCSRTMAPLSHGVMRSIRRGHPVPRQLRTHLVCPDSLVALGGRRRLLLLV